jgi:peptidoglycan hydrolase-like amidase
MMIRLMLLVSLVAVASARDVTIGVFGLFHPRKLEIVANGRRTHVTTSSRLPADFRRGTFTLSVPGRIERRYRGSLTIYAGDGELVPVLTTDLETAVASIVAAESPPGAHVESLKAQAVATRSFLVAGAGRHPHSDFCDTTHCQFLREPPGQVSVFARAAQATKGLVLEYQGHVVEALYSADCGGRTRTLADARLKPSNYPFFAVDCVNSEGVVSGHRVGLCQRGSDSMARGGALWRDILRWYFPATTVTLSNE